MKRLLVLMLDAVIILVSPIAVRMLVFTKRFAA
jgi:hypothetical protein